MSNTTRQLLEESEVDHKIWIALILHPTRSAYACAVIDTAATPARLVGWDGFYYGVGNNPRLPRNLQDWGASVIRNHAGEDINDLQILNGLPLVLVQYLAPEET